MTITKFVLIILLCTMPVTGQRLQKSADITPETDRNIDFSPIQSEKRTLALESAIDSENYFLGPGDVFGINILLAQNITLSLTVGPTGDLLIPSVGILNLDKVPLNIAQKRIEEIILSTYPNSKVDVTLQNLRTFKIQVIGAVNKPGFCEITPITRLNEIIEKADGFSPFAREFEISIEKPDGSVRKINFIDYLINGDVKQNPTFIEEDKIYVPFGDIEKECIILRGSIENVGYDIIQEGETLEQFIIRRLKFLAYTDLTKIIISRKEGGVEQHIVVEPKEFRNTILKPKDIIDVLSERGVTVNGYVQKPDRFGYYPGYTALDYVNLAGGNTKEGNADGAIVRHLNGQIEQGEEIQIKRGDVIIVPRTKKSLIFGELSVLQILVSAATLILSYYATLP